MNSEVNVPEEAVEAALDSLMDKRVEGPAEGEEVNVVRQDVREALEAAAPAISSQEHQRVREAVTLLHNNAVRCQIVAEEQDLDSSVEFTRVKTLREVLNALEDPEQPALSAERDPREEGTWPDSPSLDTAENQDQSALSEHDYLSTACHHGLHQRCRKTCKFCETECRCSCHRAALSEGVGSGAGETAPRQGESLGRGRGNPLASAAPSVQDDWPEVTLHRLPGCKPVLYGPRARPPVDAERRRYIPAPPPQAVQGEATGADLIAAERQRQISEEGWTREHDDAEDGCEMALAAMVYADPRPNASGFDPTSPELWPWEREAYKPRDYRSNLVRAGALIAAEIDRVRREEIRRFQADCQPEKGGEG